MSSSGVNTNSIINTKKEENPNGLVLVKEFDLPGPTGAAHSNIKPLLTSQEQQFLELLAESFLKNLNG